MSDDDKINVPIAGQMFEFETDTESVTVTKWEQDRHEKREDLGTILIYEDQIDGLIEQLQAAKAKMQENAKAQTGG